MKLIPALTTFAVAVSVFFTVFPDFFPVTLTGYTKVVVSGECCIYAGFRIIQVEKSWIKYRDKRHIIYEQVSHKKQIPMDEFLFFILYSAYTCYNEKNMRGTRFRHIILKKTIFLVILRKKSWNMTL